MIYFSSDFHYGHKNIVRGVSDWEDKGGCRDFPTLEIHNKTLVDNINKVVKKEDTLYFGGDWSFGGISNVFEFRKQINCEDIHLILGNHDHHIEKGSMILVSEDDIIKHDLVHSHYKMEGKYQVAVDNLFSSVSYYKELRINSRKIILCHYAMRVWNESHKGSIMLYGHSHGTLDAMTPKIANPVWLGDQYYTKNWRTMDIGIDTHPEFRPYSISEIIDIMNDRPVLLEVDHHNEKTN